MSKPLAPGPDEEPIRDLLLLAGRRPEPAAFRTARVRAAVEEEWRRSMPRRRRWPLWSWAAAAVLALTLLPWTRTPAPLPSPPSTAPVLGVVARVTGPVRVSSEGSALRAAAEGTPVTSRATIDTGAGLAALTVGAGVSIRLDRGTRIVFQEANRLTLERGRVYVDSGNSPPSGDGLRIATRSGLIQEIGTQFEVDATETSIQIRVREGAVRIQQTDTSTDVGEAEAVRLGPGGVSERRVIARSGPEWSWLDAIASPFTIEGATLERFLHWVSREQGWEWHFRNAAAERHGKGVVLHGTIKGLTPTEALEAVLPTCGMIFQLRGARLLVDLPSR